MVIYSEFKFSYWGENLNRDPIRAEKPSYQKVGNAQQPRLEKSVQSSNVFHTVVTRSVGEYLASVNLLEVFFSGPQSLISH